MTKVDFILALTERLSGLPWAEVEERLSFYDEMISDRMEEGLCEEDAVSEMGDLDEVAAQIISDVPLTKIMKVKIREKRRMKVWEILLLVLGSPIWLSILISILAVLFSVYVSLWSVVISLWACDLALVLSGVCCILGGAAFAGILSVPTGLALVGAGLVACGLSIFLFFGCKAAAKGILWLGKSVIFCIKNALVRKEGAE